MNRPKPIRDDPDFAEAWDFAFQSRPFGLKPLTREAFDQLADFVTLERVEAGEYIFREGEASSHLYFLWRGEVEMQLGDRRVFTFTPGMTLGEIGMLSGGPRRGSARVGAAADCALLALPHAALRDGRFPRGLLSELYAYLGRRATALMTGDDYFSRVDVLLVQDGGCAPGYNTVTAFLSQHLEADGHRVFVAREGFRSLVSGRSEDLCALVHDKGLHDLLGNVPRLVHSAQLQGQRGAAFRAERFPEFRRAENQEAAAAFVLARGVKVLVGIGGNGTCAGIKALNERLKTAAGHDKTPPRTFFVPVTIDSDVAGTECVGQHTAVEVGAEKVR